MPSSDPLALLGCTLDGALDLEAYVGTGSLAVVYRGTDRQRRSPIAVKCFHSLMNAPPALRDGLVSSFVLERAHLTELAASCPQFVLPHAIGTATTKDGTWFPFIAYDWQEGCSLQVVLERLRAQQRSLSLEQAMRLLQPVADALAQAHSRGLAHQHLTPGNIFLIGSDGSDAAVVVEHASLRVIDFGIAAVVQSGQDLGLPASQQASSTFTAGFAAPEQHARSRGATGPWTDVYALALLLSEIVAGKRAFGPRVEAVFRRALAVKPNERYAHASAFWHDLQEAMAAEQAPTCAEREVLDEPVRPFPAWRHWLGAALVLSALALTMARYWALHATGSPRERAPISQPRNEP